MSMSICLDVNTECQFNFDILIQQKFPQPLCDLDMGGWTGDTSMSIIFDIISHNTHIHRVYLLYKKLEQLLYNFVVDMSHGAMYENCASKTFLTVQANTWDNVNNAKTLAKTFFFFLFKMEDDAINKERYEVFINET